MQLIEAKRTAIEINRELDLCYAQQISLRTTLLQVQRAVPNQLRQSRAGGRREGFSIGTGIGAGATAGAILFGPPGAIAGALIGALTGGVTNRAFRRKN